jgi:transcriptional regulator with XRE-family HTH domain
MLAKKTAQDFPDAESWRLLDRYVGPAIQAVRVQRGITQEALAAKVSKLTRSDVRQSYFSKIESGGNCPRLARFGVICLAIGCPPDHIIKIARHLAENDGRSNEELLTEILAETPSKNRAGRKVET